MPDILPPLLLTLLVRGLVGLCVVAVFTAVLINFLQARMAGRVAHEQRSIVATGTMIGFFVAYYLLIQAGLRQGFGVHVPSDTTLLLMLQLIGLLLVMTGAAVNILGRVRLGRNWANQATVYDDHTLVTRGIFGVVRHPLYASLIWMFYGAGLVYVNYAALLATTLLFVPAMIYRARLEERLLEERFPEYTDYRRRVGMFLPKIMS